MYSAGDPERSLGRKRTIPPPNLTGRHLVLKEWWYVDHGTPWVFKSKTVK